MSFVAFDIILEGALSLSVRDARIDDVFNDLFCRGLFNFSAIITLNHFYLLGVEEIMFLFWVRKFKNEISINKLYSEVLKNDKLSESEPFQIFLRFRLLGKEKPDLRRNSNSVN